MEGHVEPLLGYLRIKEKNSEFVFPWGEYLDLFDSIVVIGDV